jgi:uncharacterized protein YdaU (DUF1376 family)
VNYYSHHIGDYLIDTAHLSILEDGVYRRLMDRYYTTEQPLTSDEQVLFRVIRARTEEEKEAVRTVLAEFFVLANGVWTHKRCDAEVAAFQAKAEANRANGVKGGRPRKEEPTKNPETTQTVSDVETQLEAKKTLTNNQEPITNNQKKPKAEAQRATRLPANWMPSEADWQFCRTERPELDARSVASQFLDYWIAQPDARGKKTDWSATWRNWVRNQRGVNQTRGSPAGGRNDRSGAAAAIFGSDEPHAKEFIDVN